MKTLAEIKGLVAQMEAKFDARQVVDVFDNDTIRFPNPERLIDQLEHFARSLGYTIIVAGDDSPEWGLTKELMAAMNRGTEGIGMIKGKHDQRKRTITLKPDLTPSLKCYVLLHELSHAVLNQPRKIPITIVDKWAMAEKKAPPSADFDREAEAELTVFRVLETLGLDTEVSVRYMASKNRLDGYHYLGMGYPSFFDRLDRANGKSTIAAATIVRGLMEPRQYQEAA